MLSFTSVFCTYKKGGTVVYLLKMLDDGTTLFLANYVYTYSLYIHYEFVHEVHNKEKMKNKREKKINNKNTDTVKQCTTHQS